MSLQAKFTNGEHVLMRQTLFTHQPKYTEVEIMFEEHGWYHVREVRRGIEHFVPPGTLTRRMYNS